MKKILCLVLACAALMFVACGEAVPASQSVGAEESSFASEAESSQESIEESSEAYSEEASEESSEEAQPDLTFGEIIAATMELPSGCIKITKETSINSENGTSLFGYKKTYTYLYDTTDSAYCFLAYSIEADGVSSISEYVYQDGALYYTYGKIKEKCNMNFSDAAKIIGFSGLPECFGYANYESLSYENRVATAADYDGETGYLLSLLIPELSEGSGVTLVSSVLQFNTNGLYVMDICGDTQFEITNINGEKMLCNSHYTCEYGEFYDTEYKIEASEYSESTEIKAID